MKRLQKKSKTEIQDLNTALYNDENGTMIKDEVLDTLVDSIDEVGTDAQFEKFAPEDGVQGEAGGTAVMKWSALESKYGVLTDTDKHNILEEVENIDAIKEALKEELQDSVDPGYTVETIDVKFSETPEGILIAYSADEISYDKNIARDY